MHQTRLSLMTRGDAYYQCAEGSTFQEPRENLQCVLNEMP